jgi:RNA exonuclease 4
LQKENRIKIWSRPCVQVLGLNHPATAIRDTVLFFTLQGQSKSLKHLAERLLGQNIQTGRHSSVEDARAPVLLYRKFW